MRGGRSVAKKENKFKAELKKELKDLFPGCVLVDMNPNEQQGVSDL